MDIEDDIGGDIAAALNEAKGVEASAPAASAPEAPAEDAKPSQPRAADGKFAPRGESAAPEAPASEVTQNTDPPAAAATEAQGEPIRPPAAWSAAAKAKFPTLDPEVQAEIAKRERDMDKGLADRAAQLKRYEPLEQVIEPHRNRLAMSGVDEATYVRSLIAADEMLRGPNRVQAIHQIAQMYGVDLRQAMAPGQQPQQAQLPQEYQSLARTVAELQATLAQQQSAAQQAEMARHQADIEAFAKDHLYFENVRADMAALMRSGQAKDLAEAYDMACWARPDVRPLMLAEQEKKRADEAAAAARAKANEARQASGSITGSPAPGSAPPPANANGSIEDDVRASWAAASLRA